MSRTNHLDEIAPLGMSKRNSPKQRFPIRRCSNVVGGKLLFLKRKRKDGSSYSIPLRIGGKRCTNRAEVSRDNKPLCLDCLGKSK